LVVRDDLAWLGWPVDEPRQGADQLLPWLSTEKRRREAGLVYSIFLAERPHLLTDAAVVGIDMLAVTRSAPRYGCTVESARVKVGQSAMHSLGPPMAPMRRVSCCRRCARLVRRGSQDDFD
jgi:hypothetical protein